MSGFPEMLWGGVIGFIVKERFKFGGKESTVG